MNASRCFRCCIAIPCPVVRRLCYHAVLCKRTVPSLTAGDAGTLCGPGHSSRDEACDSWQQQASQEWSRHEPGSGKATQKSPKPHTKQQLVLVLEVFILTSKRHPGLLRRPRLGRCWRRRSRRCCSSRRLLLAAAFRLLLPCSNCCCVCFSCRPRQASRHLGRQLCTDRWRRRRRRGCLLRLLTSLLGSASGSYACCRLLRSPLLVPGLLQVALLLLLLLLCINSIYRGCRRGMARRLAVRD